MQQDYAQANIDAAHSLEERFHRTWDQLWDEAGLFVNARKGFAWTWHEVIANEQPFVCVRDGRALSYASLIYTDVPADRNALGTVLCYPCKQRDEAKRRIADFAHGRVA
jgi:hypothetical protein